MELDTLIKEFEGCRLTAYRNFPDEPWTVGWGATGSGITQSTVWSQAQADRDLQQRLTDLSGRVKTLAVRQLSSGQLYALVSLAYNIGTDALAKSRLLTAVQASKDLVAAREFLAWDHVGGKEVKGLLRRRLREAFVYLS